MREGGAPDSGFLDAGFIDKHDGDIVANGVDAVALHALQSRSVVGELDLFLAHGAGKNVEQFFADWHCDLRTVRLSRTAAKRELVLGSGQKATDVLVMFGDNQGGADEPPDNRRDRLSVEQGPERKGGRGQY